MTPGGRWGLRGGSDSKRSDGDGEAETEAAESVECVAEGLMPAESEIPMELVSAVVGAVEVVAERLPVNALGATMEGDAPTARLAHSMRTRLFVKSAKMTLPLTINHEIVGTVEACLEQWDVVYKISGGMPTKIAGGTGACKVFAHSH